LETELAKARPEVELELRLEFDQRLAKEQEILAAKYEGEVDELCTSLGVKVESRDAKIDELETLRRLDDEKHKAELSLWGMQDRKHHAGLQGLEDALHGMFPSSLPDIRSFAPFPRLLVALAEAFPASDEVAAAAVDEYQVKQKIVHSEDPQARLSSGELTASTKGWLQPVAKLGSELRQAVISVFKALWPGQVVLDDIGMLL
jgi:hypothetical protein